MDAETKRVKTRDRVRAHRARETPEKAGPPRNERGHGARNLLMAKGQGPRPLTAKQERFVAEYLVDYNAAAAYVRAGYSAKGAKQAAFKLLTNADLRARVREMQAEHVAELGDVAKAAVIALVRALADPGQTVQAARALLDRDARMRDLTLKEEALALKKAQGSGNAEPTAKVVPMPVRATGVEDFRRRARETLQRAKAGRQ